MTKNQYSVFGLKLSNYAKAISNPARMQTMLYLAENESMTFGEINEKYNISKATLSQHLTELKEAGLIVGQKVGQKTYYSINEEGWCDFKMLFDKFTSHCPCERHGTAQTIVTQWKLANPTLVTPASSCCCCSGDEEEKK